MQVRGILKNANRVAIPAGGFSLCGNIFDDAKGQYRDGWYVYTGDCCGNCSSFTMVRNGTCLKCETCGETTGCS